MKRILSILMVSLFMMAVMAITANVAFAEACFGSGSSCKPPQTGKCHPPGQTTTTPGCKN